jgi:hypothetical protein
MAFGVVGVQRLLDPGEVQWFDERGRRSAARWRSHCWLASTISGARRRHAACAPPDALEVDHGVGLADLDLDAADAALERLLHVGQHLGSGVSR